MPSAWLPVGRWVRAVPWLVWVATGVFAVVLAAWSILIPLYEAPDEPAHVDLVMHLAAGGSYPSYDDRQWSTAVLADCGKYVATQRRCPARTDAAPAPGGGHRTWTWSFGGSKGPGLRPHPLSGAPSKGSGAGFDALGGDKQVGPPNQLPQHPPLYYEGAGLVVRAERFLPGTWSMAGEVALLRLLSVAMVAPLPLLAWATAHVLGLARPVTVVAAWLPLAVPQLAHIGSTVNNDAPLIVLASLALLGCASVLGGDRSLRTAAGLGAVSGCALLVKSSGAAAVVAVLATYAVAAVRDRRVSAGVRRRVSQAALIRAGAFLAVAAAVAGWWYVRNKVTYGTFTPNIEDGRLDERLQPPGFVPVWAEWRHAFRVFLPSRFWGWFGWFSVRASPALAHGSTVAVLVLAAVALVAGPQRRSHCDGALDLPQVTDPNQATDATGANAAMASTGLVGQGGAADVTDSVEPLDPAEPVGTVGGDRSTIPASMHTPTRIDFIVLALPVALLLGLIVWRSWSLYVQSSRTPFLQGRYLFPGLSAAAVVLAVAVHRLVGRWALPVVIGWALVMHVDAVLAVLPGYWGAPGVGPVGQLRAVVAWTPWPGELVAAVTAAAATAVVIAGVKAATHAGRRAEVAG